VLLEISALKFYRFAHDRQRLKIMADDIHYAIFFLQDSLYDQGLIMDDGFLMTF